LASLLKSIASEILGHLPIHFFEVAARMKKWERLQVNQFVLRNADASADLMIFQIVKTLCIRMAVKTNINGQLK